MNTFISGRLRSIRCATNGITYILRSQRNAWLHLLATLFVIITAWSLHLSPAEWCWMALATGIVWIAESLNTALELVCDVASPNFHPTIRRAKDAAAGGVLLAALTSLTIATFILGPHLLSLRQ